MDCSHHCYPRMTVSYQYRVKVITHIKDCNLLCVLLVGIQINHINGDHLWGAVCVNHVHGYCKYDVDIY